MNNAVNNKEATEHDENCFLMFVRGFCSKDATSDLQKSRHLQKKSVKTAVLDDRRPPGAVVLTKLVEWYRFKVGHIFFVIFVTCRSRVICKKVASRSGTIGAQSEN